MTAAVRPADAIDAFFGRHPPDRIGVAVSGGSDSLALLHLLADWGGASLAAVTVDHGLRPGSAGEAAHVAHLCEGLGIPHTVLKWEGWDGRGNLQDQARRTRYSMMADWGAALGVGCIALGHTLDDQAETFLLRLAREAGVDGLSGMAPFVTRHGMRFCRPLLGQRRADLRALLSERGVRWVEDPSNLDEDFARVRARKALGLLDPLGIGAETIARTAAHLQEAREALSHAAMEFARDTVKSVAGDLIFDRARLNRQPAEIRRRLLAGALRWVASAEYPPRRDALAELEAALAARQNFTLHGCLVMASDMTVRITREHAAVAGLSGPTDRPWDTRWTLEGPDAPDLEIRALGEAVKDCPGWRDTGLPRATLLASPAIWRGETLVAAPLAGVSAGWTAKTRGSGDFAAFLLAH